MIRTANRLSKKFLERVQPPALLLLTAVIAIICANTSLKDVYFQLLHSKVNVTIGNYNLFSHNGHAMSLEHFVNDALMAVFFFVIGLEIKKEILLGELSSIRKALLPIIGAIGGMVVPVLVFLIFAHEQPAMRGAAIPMATDIAFALAVLSLLGNRVPLSLKIFLTALAVVDDIGGILVIALFYSSEIYWIPLLVGVGLLLLSYYLGRQGIYKPYVYYIIGFFVWTFFLRSGIHTTISGVLLAMTIPAKARIKLPRFKEQLEDFTNSFDSKYVLEGNGYGFISEAKLHSLKRLNGTIDRTISPVQNIEHDLHILVSYMILPLFAFVNSGVEFGDISMNELMGLPLAIGAGLFVGKALGIFGVTYLCHKMGFVQYPKGMNHKNLLGISLFGGIGFTVSLFIANLSYADIPVVGLTLLNQAKIGVIAGTIISGLLGYLILNTILKKQAKTSPETK